MSFNPEIKKEEIELLINKDFKKTKIANKLNISRYTLCKYLNYYKLTVPNKIRPDIDKQWLIDNWVNTPYSTRELAERENIPQRIIEDRCCRYGLKKKFKYHVNTAILFNLQDPQIWYLAGLIATDGYLADCPDSFEVTLTGEDEYVLLSNIKNYLESDAPIGNFNGASRLKICADGIRNFLLNNFSIPKENKTYNVSIPKKFPNEDCAKAYILGCLDGDGHIGKKKFSLVNSAENFIKGFKDIIYTYTGIKICFRYELRKKTKNYYPCVDVTGKKAIQILDWVYSTTCNFYLNRKYKKYLELKMMI